MANDTNDDEHAAAPTLPFDPDSPLCPYFQCAIELIGRKWVGAILYMLQRGPRRFNELLTAVPNLSDRLLTERLRELENRGLIMREVQPGPPVKVIYSLTPAGQDLSGVIVAVSAWGHKWLAPESVAGSTERDS